MSSVGELIAEAADQMDYGQPRLAFHAAARAFASTAARVTGVESPGPEEIQQVIDKEWEMLRFLTFPSYKSEFLDMEAYIPEISYEHDRNHSIKEFLSHLILKTLREDAFPMEFGFTVSDKFDRFGGVLSMPKTVIPGLMAFSIVHPLNKDEEIEEKYWISISGFTMFVTEYWGRFDLALRIRKVHLGW